MFEYKNQKLSIQIRNRFSSSKNPEDYSLGGEDGLEETPLQINPQGIRIYWNPELVCFNLSGTYDWREKLFENRDRKYF